MVAPLRGTGQGLRAAAFLSVNKSRALPIPDDSLVIFFTT